MHNLLLYKSFILRSLVTMLADEGIEVTTGTAINIEKILARTNLEQLKNLSELKYKLTPLISRNKEEQEAVYKIFDKLDKKIIDEYKPVEEEQGETVIEKEIKKHWKKITSPWYLKRVLVPAVLIMVVSLAVYFLKDRIIPPFPEKPMIGVDVNPNPQVIGDTVHFAALFHNSLDTSIFTVDWKFPDTVIANTFTFSRVYGDTTSSSVIAYLKNPRGIVIDSYYHSIHVLCELPPYVTIDETDVSALQTKIANTNKKRFEPLVTNAKDSARYSYKWYVDDSLYSTAKVLNYARPYNTIKLVVACNGAHCSTDSLVTQAESVPAVNLESKGDGNLTLQETYNWKNILMTILLLAFVPGIVSFLVFRIILSVKSYLPEIKDAEPGTEGPYQIRFNDQQHNIGVDEGIRRMADMLRKREVSDIYKLDLRKTIRSTVVSGGIPKLEYTPLSKPATFLAFIDKEKPESHLVKLFEWLVEKLRKDEVNIYVYEYFKEPLFLSNEKLNQNRIPLQKLASLYPDTTLFIFGNAQYFLYPLKGTVKNWVTRKLNNWPTKILITPYAKEDWDKKEKLLIESNFVVLPADLSSLPVLDKIISRQIDIPAQKKEHIKSGYRARQLNFQDFEILKNYLGEGQLLQWVCSLAVYPSVDWDLTIAMGKAMEDEFRKKNVPIDLVNYSNLLKVGRISWMQDGIINESLRANMMAYLDKDAEALAREALQRQLNLIEGKIRDDSLVKIRFDIHRKLNKFLLDSYEGRHVPKEEEAFIKKLLQSKQLDEGQDIYLDEGNNSLVSHPYRKGKEVGLSRYFKLKTYRKIAYSSVFAFVLLVLLMSFGYKLLSGVSDYLNWSSIPPVDQTYILNVSGNNIDRELSVDLYYEPGDTAFTRRTIRLANMTDTFHYQAISLKDTLAYGHIRVWQTDGSFIREDSFKLNSRTYNIRIDEVSKIPIDIYYKDEASLALANSIAENLPSNYSVNLRQRYLDNAGMVSVFYFSPQRREDALVAATAINNVLNRNIQPLQADSREFGQVSAEIFIYVNQSSQPGSCTQLEVLALPLPLTEIWVGGTSRRFVNINIPQGLLFYSNDNGSSFTKYRINEVCLSANGTYRVIVSNSDMQYKLMFFKNVKTQSFELSVCEGLAKTRQELQDKDESYCDRFNVMRWYYENNPGRIYLPVSGNVLSPGEKAKLDRKADSLENGYSITLSSSEAYVSDITVSELMNFLSKSGIRPPVSRNNTPTNLSRLPFEPIGPFQRNYFSIILAKKPEPAKPDCSVTFTSLAEIEKQGDPLIVCKLDLSNNTLRNLPKELYSFTNLQQLFLGLTNIPQSDIDALQMALPNCEIVYQPVGQGIAPRTNIPGAGKVICVVTKLNIRSSPSFNAAVVGVVSKGTAMDYTEVVNGESQDGISRWFKNSDGNYFWSGGVSLYTSPAPTEQELGFLGFNAYQSLDKESYTLMQDIASYLRQNSGSRIRLEADDGYDIYMPRIEAAIKEFSINNAQVEKVNTGNTKQQQKQDQLKLQKPVRVVGINFPANFSSPSKK